MDSVTISAPVCPALPGEGSDGREAVVRLFHTVVVQVPAYRQFLADAGVDPAGVRSYEDFRALPQVSKENYVQRYPLADRCRHGAIESCDMIAVSSGSTGTPTFWLRSLADEANVARRFEQAFYDGFHTDERRTLAVICFALGTWVGGMFTASCCRLLAGKGYPITTVTPGSNKDEIFRVVEGLGSQFDQVVLLGYPPFLKDVIDTGRARGLDWSRAHIKLVMAGEVFSEEWRSLVAGRVSDTDILHFSASQYGTADAGVLACETPLSVAIRRFLAQHPQAARQLFGASRLPTLAQYDPVDRFFEVDGDTLLFSGDNGMPLIRYNILDSGGIMTYDAMLAFLAERGYDPREELAGGRGDRNLPFAWVFGRSNFTISYFGANVFPENVTVGLEQPLIREWVTGKFVMQSMEDAECNRYLAIAVELAPGVTGDAHKQQAIAEAILTHLLRLNSEFAHYVPAPYQLPRVTLHQTGDPEYFPIGVKHRYTRK
jgi:phenylacetate-CoA ligase